jgi:hypothetical protein
LIEKPAPTKAKRKVSPKPIGTLSEPVKQQEKIAEKQLARQTLMLEACRIRTWLRFCL